MRHLVTTNAHKETLEESYNRTEVVSEDPLVTWNEFKAHCREGCPEAEDQEMQDQWDEMLEEQHKNWRKRVKGKDGQFMLALLGHGKTVMRDVEGSGSRDVDGTREEIPDPAAGGGSEGGSEGGPGRRLSSMFSSFCAPPSTTRFPSKQPSGSQRGPGSASGRNNGDNEVRPEDSVSNTGKNGDVDGEPRASKRFKLNRPFGAALAAADGKVLNSVEFLQAKVGHV